MTRRIPSLLIPMTALALGGASVAHAAQYPFTSELRLDSSDIFQSGKPQFADLDQDGDQDVVLSGYYSLWWYEYDGDFEEMTERNIDPALQSADRAVVADIDDDGDPDIVSSGGGLRWYENVESGAAWVAHPVGADDSISGDVEAGDVDGDGDLDVIIADYGADQVHWYENPGDGAGDWGAPHIVPASLFDPDTIAFGDFDGDGDGDLMVADNYNEYFYLLRYDGGPWIESALDLGTGVNELRVVDVDGDGDLDVLNGQPRAAVLMRNLGDGLFGYEELINSDNLIVNFRLDVGDMDADGDEDLVAVSGQDGYGILYFENDGGEYVAEHVVLADRMAGSSGIDVEDLDCDGDADIMAHASHPSSWSVTLFVNEINVPGADACGDGPVEPDPTGGEDETGGDDDAASTGAEGGTDQPGDDDDDDGSGDGGTGGPAAADDDGGGSGGLCSIDADRRAPASMMALALLGLLQLRRRRVA